MKRPELEKLLLGLERLAAGDTRVKLEEAIEDPSLDKLRRMINMTAENFSEIVDTSHEFAIGLAEHFDVLQKVSSGNLQARICGDSKQEILGFLKNLTNSTIGQLASEIETRRSAQKELIKLATAVEQAAEGMVITDADGVCEYANPAFETMTGYTKNEICGEKLRVLEDEMHGAHTYDDMWKSIKKGQVWRGKMTNRKRSGETYDEECTVSPIRNTDGNITNYVMVKRDVTRDVEMKKRMHQSQKLEALGTLAGGIAHELNNLLTPILGFSELALDSVDEKSRVSKDIKQIYDAAHRAREIIWQVLEFARMEEDKVIEEAIDLVPVLKDTLRLLRASIPSTIELDHEIEMDSAVAMADVTQIQQVLMNLATNAAAALSGDEGYIRITMCPASQGELPPDAAANGKYIKISVADNGTGIPDEIAERIFEPFFTTKQVGEGTGLGLSVVHGIISRIKGHISVESSPGRGTKVNIYLPSGEIGHSLLKPELMEELWRGDELILLVDDEYEVREVLSRFLESFGYRVESCPGGSDALMKLEGNADFQLVITDYAMPKMNGVTLAENIHSTLPDLPILLCTGFGSNIPMEKAGSSGIIKIIEKPVNREELVRAVRSALDE